MRGGLPGGRPQHDPAMAALQDEGDHPIVDPVATPALDGLRAELEGDGRATTLQVHVTGQGHGPLRLRLRLRLDGQDLPVDRVDHPNRRGGVRLARSRWAAGAGSARLELWLA